MISANGSHGRFEPIARKAEILVCSHCSGLSRRNIVQPVDWCPELKKRPDYNELISGKIDPKLVSVELQMVLSPLDKKTLQSHEQLVVTNRNSKAALVIHGIYFTHWYRGKTSANRQHFADAPNNMIYTYCVPPGQSAVMFKQKSKFAKENHQNKMVIHLDTNTGELISNPKSYVAGVWTGGIPAESW